MHKLLQHLAVAFLVTVAATAGAQIAPADDAAIRAAMQTSADDWNRGDLDAFATSYKNSPDILFMGRTIRHGYAEMLASYKKNYDTPEKRGFLTFSDIAIHDQPTTLNSSTMARS